MTAVVGQSVPPTQQGRNERTYLEVPFEQKERAKAAGARWDPRYVRWYVPPFIDLSDFQPWLKRRVFLREVPDYETSEHLKDMGAKFDRVAGRLYITSELDGSPFQGWVDADYVDHVSYSR